MPSTRSATRSASIAVSKNTPETLSPIPTEKAPSSRKRKVANEAPVDVSVSSVLPKVKRAKSTSKAPKPSFMEEDHVPSAPRVPIILDADATVIPPQLSFSLDEAKAHLIAVDNRFEEMFANVKCKPFEILEPLDPFKSLVMSILGQQISWLAARSIAHKFLRLFNPSLPISPPEHGDDPIEFFPTAKQVSDTSIETLRTAGLSQRKAEYVKDVAARFADGRLSAAKLALWNEEEVAENLIAVRGIGPWTVHMFSMFSLRRPDVLGVGDLGLQKGLLRWVISSHTGTSAKAGIAILPKKIKKQSKATAAAELDPPAPPPPALVADTTALPPVPDPLSAATATAETESQASSSLGTTLVDSKETPRGLIADHPIELPPGLTLSTLKARLNGSKVKGQYLTPEEMYFLTRPWRPYRSLGCYYLWALAEEE